MLQMIPNYKRLQVLPPAALQKPLGAGEQLIAQELASLQRVAHQRQGILILSAVFWAKKQVKSHITSTVLNKNKDFFAVQ